MTTYDPHRRTVRHYAEVLTDPAWQQYGEAREMLWQRSKMMSRKLGIYKPGGDYYPMPEPDTDHLTERLSRYFAPIYERSYARFLADIGPRNADRILHHRQPRCGRKGATS